MKSKTKIMTIAAASLACIAVAGVGFASWVITGTAGDEIQGNVNIESVNNEYVSVSILETPAPDKDISFTYKTGSYTYDWLQQQQIGEEQLKQEDLTVSFTLKVTNAAQLTSGVTLDFTANTVEIEDVATDVWAQAVGNDLVADFSGIAIAYAGATNGNATYSDGLWTIPAAAFAGDVNVAVTITFAWGSAFTPAGDGAVPVNPAQYYNNQTQTSELVADAATKLGQLEVLAGVTFDIVIEPVTTS